jgi:hypothetical protein
MSQEKTRKTHFIWHIEWKTKLCLVNLTGGVIETLCLILSKETKCCTQIKRCCLFHNNFVDSIMLGHLYTILVLLVTQFGPLLVFSYVIQTMTKINVKNKIKSSSDYMMKI